MRPFRTSTFRTIAVPLGFCLWLMTGLFASSQTAASGSVSGVVRNAQGAVVPHATVTLLSHDGDILKSDRTDETGKFHFTAVVPGVYRLRATIPPDLEAHADSFRVAAQKACTFDLRLVSSNLQSGTPDFFDQPAFTVAGVTDTTNLGGHGADTITRTKESLAKDVVALAKTDTAVTSGSERALRDAAVRAPGSFEANFHAGSALLAAGHPQDAILFLQQAHQLQPLDYENEYALARAFAATGQWQASRTIASRLIQQGDRADLHNLLGNLEEQSGNSLQSAREYQRAAEMDPSERNLFDWGAELLMHHAPEQAVQIFTNGVHRYPASPRMLTGLGVAWFVRGDYEKAAEILCRASDLDPHASSPYLFLGNILAVEPAPMTGISHRLARFLQQSPENPVANYLVALSLWKMRRVPEDPAVLDRIRALLAKATSLDPRYAAAFLQQGIVLQETARFNEALAAYQQAVAINSKLSEAHYRMAQIYRRSGDQQKAAAELAIHKQLEQETAERTERERHEIQQFVFASQSRPAQPATKP